MKPEVNQRSAQPSQATEYRRLGWLDADGETKRSERMRRFQLSSQPVTVEARIGLGKRMQLLQKPSGQDRLPVPPGVVDGAGERSEWPGDRSSWMLRPTNEDVAITSAGCSNAFGIVGAPGCGKTHL